MELKDKVKAIKDSKQVHSKWYLETYPDVQDSGMDAATHYLIYGAHMGRNPGKNFDTNFYLSTYPEVKESGINPLLHYVLEGRDKNYIIKPKKKSSKNTIGEANTKLLNFGFTEQPLIELETIARNDESGECRILASQKIAIWHSRSKQPGGIEKCLEWISICRDNNPTLSDRRGLSVLEVVSLCGLGDKKAASEAAERAILSGEISPDLNLACVQFEDNVHNKFRHINRVLSSYGIPGISLNDEEHLSLYDRLHCTQYLPVTGEGPKVTVLVAAYEANQTLHTALRSLQSQTWNNIEVIILDDCSPTSSVKDISDSFIEKDKRFKYIRLAENGGAYIARNRGLLEAEGEFVTLHDADDWSHPQKIETQVRFLMDNPEAIGCTSEQARCTDDLSFNVVRRLGSLIIPNISSFMFRRTEVLEAVGGWDRVRFGADVQFINRIKKAFGSACCIDLRTGPLSFQRSSEGSATGHSAFGFDGFKFGVRRVYEQLSDTWLEKQEIGKIDPALEESAFTAPAPMLKNRPNGVRRFDVIIASDFRFPGGTTSSNAEEIKAQAELGLTTGLIELFYYNMSTKRPMNEKITSLIEEGKAELVCFGEEAECDNLIIRQPMAFDFAQRYVPKIRAKKIHVIINQPPMRDYSSEGVRLFDLRQCARAVTEMFGGEAIWYPIGPLVRNALLDHHADELEAINLADTDWPNIINQKEWRRDSHPDFNKRPIKICRHSRDSYAKWPASADVILGAYPSSDEFQINVLGGATAPKAVLGGKLPENWNVEEFGAVHPKDFLANQDIFAYFTHPDWVEAFGRVIFEPMAVGVPVILPRGVGYEALFGEAAIYADPHQVSSIARDLYRNPSKYVAQVEIASAIIQKKFSYNTHLERIAI